MRASWTGWSALALAVLALVLVITNVALAVLNQRIQAEAASRQRFIAEQADIHRVGETLVRSLTSAATATKDPQLIAMMQRHGLSTSGGAAPRAPAAPTGKSK